MDAGEEQSLCSIACPCTVDTGQDSPACLQGGGTVTAVPVPRQRRLC